MGTLEENIVVQQGVTWQRVYALLNPPASIDGYTAQMQIRETVASTTTLADWSTDGGQIAVDDTNKQIIVTVPASETRALDFTIGRYDLELRGGGKEWRVAQGSARLDREVTR